jgi:uncharacterized RDD family membrane protein YckC
MISGTHAPPHPMSATESDVHVTGRRIVATLIDAIILGAAYNILVAMFGEFENPRPWEWHGSLDNVPANILYAIGVALYFVLMEGYLGQTFGKMVTGITVVREDGSTPPGLGAALVRTVLRIVDGILGYLVAFIAVLISDKRQRLGDIAAHTLVVRR